MTYEVENINELDEDTLRRKEGKMAVKSFSRVYSGLFIFTFIAGIALIAIELALAHFLGEDMFSAILNDTSALWVLNMVAMYAVAFPIFMLYIKPVPKRESMRKGKIGGLEFLRLFFVSYASMQLLNMLANVITDFIHNTFGVEQQASGGSDIPLAGTPLIVTLLVVVIIGPIFEELLFRKVIIGRLGRYGEKMAVIVSSVAFGFFHGNLNQMMYTIVFGLILGNMYVKTGKLRYSILMHIVANFFGTVPSLVMQNCSSFIENAENTDSQEYIIANLLLVSLAILVYAFIAIGIVVLLRSKKTGLFNYCYECEIDISPWKRIRSSILNSGAFWFFLIFTYSILITLIPIDKLLV